MSVRVDIMSRMQSDGELRRRKNGLYDARLNDWIIFDGLRWVKPSPQSDGEPRVRGELRSSYRSLGELETSESLALNVAAEVVDIRPNGNLVLEGRATTRINDEMWTVTLVRHVPPGVHRTQQRRAVARHHQPGCAQVGNRQRGLRLPTRLVPEALRYLPTVLGSTSMKQVQTHAGMACAGSSRSLWCSGSSGVRPLAAQHEIPTSDARVRPSQFQQLTYRQHLPVEGPGTQYAPGHGAGHRPERHGRRGVRTDDAIAHPRPWTSCKSPSMGDSKSKSKKAEKFDPKNVALVMVTADIPEQGARQGDELGLHHHVAQCQEPGGRLS